VDRIRETIQPQIPNEPPLDARTSRGNSRGESIRSELKANPSLV